MLNSAWVDEPIFVGWATPTDASNCAKRRWAMPTGRGVTPKRAGYRCRPGTNSLQRQPLSTTFRTFFGGVPTRFLNCRNSFLDLVFWDRPPLKQCQIVPNSAISTVLDISDPLRGVSCPPFCEGRGLGWWAMLPIITSQGRFKPIREAPVFGFAIMLPARGNDVVEPVNGTFATVVGTRTATQWYRER